MDHAITKTIQINKWSCLLACIESFNRDHRNIITQQDIINHSKGSLCREDGYVNRLCMKAIMNKYNIDFQINNNLKFPFEDKYENALFLAINPSKHYLNDEPIPPGVRHIVRYNRMLNDKEFVVMNPDNRIGLQLWTEDEYKPMKSGIYIVNWINQ